MGHEHSTLRGPRKKMNQSISRPLHRTSIIAVPPTTYRRLNQNSPKLFWRPPGKVPGKLGVPGVTAEIAQNSRMIPQRVVCMERSSLHNDACIHKYLCKTLLDLWFSPILKFQAAAIVSEVASAWINKGSGASQVRNFPGKVMHLESEGLVCLPCVPNPSCF